MYLLNLLYQVFVYKIPLSYYIKEKKNFFILPCKKKTFRRHNIIQLFIITKNQSTKTFLLICEIFITMRVNYTHTHITSFITHTYTHTTTKKREKGRVEEKKRKEKASCNCVQKLYVGFGLQSVLQ